MKLGDIVDESGVRPGSECTFKELSQGEYFRFKYGPGKFQKVNDIHYEELNDGYMHTAGPEMRIVKLAN